VGNNFADNFAAIKATVNYFKKQKIEGVIYQFNLNDLLPYTKKDIKEFKHVKAKRMTTKLIYLTSDIRAKYLNRSVMFRVLANRITRLLYSNFSNDSCEKLDIEALGPYTYTFRAKKFESLSDKLWTRFEDNLVEIKKELKDIPFVILITPIANLIEPDMKIHIMSRPKRFDCATINPIVRLGKICDKLDINLVDPTEYMKTYFDNYVKGGNAVRFYHLNDDNHLNEIGSRYFSEYSYIKIFKNGVIKTSASEKNQ